MKVSTAACALALVAAMSGVASAETRVYRCEEGARVTYSDVPCSNARVLTIDAGTAAPDARERLRRDQDALDVGAAARRDALAREATLARMQGPGVAEPPRAPGSTGDDAVYDFAYAPYGAYGNARRRGGVKDREREREKRRASVITQPLPTPLRGR